MLGEQLRDKRQRDLDRHDVRSRELVCRYDHFPIIAHAGENTRGGGSVNEINQTDLDLKMDLNCILGTFSDAETRSGKFKLFLISLGFLLVSAEGLEPSTP